MLRVLECKTEQNVFKWVGVDECVVGCLVLLELTSINAVKNAKYA